MKMLLSPGAQGHDCTHGEGSTAELRAAAASPALPQAAAAWGCGARCGGWGRSGGLCGGLGAGKGGTAGPVLLGTSQPYDLKNGAVAPRCC